jgi:hypothetical protein
MFLGTQIAPAAQTALENCKDVLSLPWYVLPVGWASVALAVVCVVPTIFSDKMIKDIAGRVIWVVLIGTCLWAEWTAIRWDVIVKDSQRSHDECESRNQFVKVGNNLNKNFHDTGVGIQASIDAAQQSLTAATNSFDKAKEAVDFMTGGNSFPYIDFNTPYGEVAVARKKGNFPVHDLEATFFTGACDNKGIWGGCKYVMNLGTKAIPQINMGPVTEDRRGFVRPGPSGVAFAMREIFPADQKDLFKNGMPFLFIDLLASNGFWREYFWTDYKISPNGTVLDFKKAIRIYSTRIDKHGEILGRNLIWECRSKGFPEKQLGADFFDGNFHNITYYGHPLHINHAEEGGIIDDFPYVDVPECN